MRDDICTIPVSEVFEVSDGCPICRMRSTVEEHIVDYIMGAAMMEPYIRIETNKYGFCSNHLLKMHSHRGRLALALMLQTHIDCVNDDIFKRKLFNNAKVKNEKIKKLNDSCFVCNKINWGMDRMVETVYRCYETESDFRKLFDNQPMFCMEHYELLVGRFNKRNMARHGDEFLKSLRAINSKYISALSDDLKNYCKIYSYQNNKEDCDWQNAKDSVERTISFLSGEKF